MHRPSTLRDSYYEKKSKENKLKAKLAMHES